MSKYNSKPNGNINYNTLFVADDNENRSMLVKQNIINMKYMFNNFCRILY